MPKRTIAGFATAAALAGGGTVATDAAINPYEVSAEKYELRAESTLEAAGENKIEAHRDRPAITLSKWSGEAGMTVAYSGVDARGTRQFLTDRVEWKGEKEEVHAYPLEAKEGMEDGGFEIEVVLDERPDTSVWEFQIEGAEDLDFFYQPALTDEAPPEGARICTPTECLDDNGEILAHRPENVVGSFAVYHKDKANHRVGGANYATGKAFHVYRPKAIDANGVEEWCELSFEGSTLSVACSEKWLESATYPVRIDPTFGYTSIGASVTSMSETQPLGNRTETSGADAAGATLTHITFYVDPPAAARSYGAAIYASGLTVTKLSEDTGNYVSSGTTPGWFSVNMNYTLAASQSYGLYVWVSGNSSSRHYDSASNRGAFRNGDIFETWPTTGSWTNYNFRSSIYATYTASGGGGSAPPDDGVVIFE